MPFLGVGFLEVESDAALQSGINGLAARAVRAPRANLADMLVCAKMAVLVLAAVDEDDAQVLCCKLRRSSRAEGVW